MRFAGDHDVAWLRTLCWMVASLSGFALLTSPALAASEGSPVQVTVTPTSAHPGEVVAVSFSSSHAAITGCRAELDGQALPRCEGSGSGWSVHFTVPAGAKPGPRRIGWAVTYRADTSDDVPTREGEAKGAVPFTVLASIPIVTPTSARPAGTASSSGTPAGHTTGSRPRRALPPGPVHGDVPVAARSGADLHLAQVGLFALIALVGVSLVLRRTAGHHGDPTPGHHVRAVVHAGSPPRLHVRQSDEGPPTRVVRFATRRTLPSCTVNEVP